MAGSFFWPDLNVRSGMPEDNMHNLSSMRRHTASIVWGEGAAEVAFREDSNGRAIYTWHCCNNNNLEEGEGVWSVLYMMFRKERVNLESTRTIFN